MFLDWTIINVNFKIVLQISLINGIRLASKDFKSILNIIKLSQFVSLVKEKLAKSQTMTPFQKNMPNALKSLTSMIKLLIFGYICTNATRFVWKQVIIHFLQIRNSRKKKKLNYAVKLRPNAKNSNAKLIRNFMINKSRLIINA